MFRQILRNTTHHPPRASPRPSRLKKFLYFNFGLVTLSVAAYYFLWPKHTFPSPVAKILRKGLWAESDKGEKDYQLALKHYLEALEECDQLGMDPLCDEYTGIQLKIGEMYERLDMMDEAAFTYNEIATLYLSVLKAPADSEQGKRIKNIDHRAHLIQRDLRIALKLVELNRLSPLSFVTITASFDYAGKLTQVGWAFAACWFSDLVDCQASEQIMQAGLDGTANCQFASDPGRNCVKSGWASGHDRKSIRLSVPPEKPCCHNTASLFYLQAEYLQAEEQALRKKFAEAAGVDYAKVKAIHDPLQPITVGEDEANEIRAKIAEVVSDEEKKEYEEIVSNKENFLRMVMSTYDSVIVGAKRLPPETVKENTTIAESVALATYGLGVVNLHLSEYDKAERLLREARVRSKACGYTALIDEIERELQKLFNEKKNIEKKQSSIELDIHMNH
ncbi:hypothetical protein E0198_004938 [Clavispora lusitaniae]|nr:hypothetical protein E0198_004938 [Clavispora lusitaniae]